ncbi:hypothetical protein EDC04DRAFT_2733459, partial [Pisolithus marmoratus]
WKCDRRHPPGRKAYQHGAHTIWEVDGAIDKSIAHSSTSQLQTMQLNIGLNMLAVLSKPVLVQ